MLATKATQSSAVRATAVQVAPKASSVQTRRDALLAVGGVLLAGLAAPKTALARDAQEAAKEKEARRAALRAAAGEAKASGRDKGEVFATPEYSLSEEARTSNFRTRQAEGARTQDNA